MFQALAPRAPTRQAVEVIRHSVALVFAVCTILVGGHRRRSTEIPLPVDAASSLLAQTAIASGFHERILFGYLLFLLLPVVHGAGPHRLVATALVSLDFAVFLLAMVLVRGELVRPSLWRQRAR